MWTGRAVTCCCFAATLSWGAAARGDAVKLRSKPAFRNVTVTSFHDGRLVFRGVSRQLLRKSLAEIEWVVLEHAPAFSEAENAAFEGRWDHAIAAYERALPEAKRAWLRYVVQLRMLEACDRGGRFARAVSVYADLVTRKPNAARVVAPRRPAPPGSDENAKARQTLRAALRRAPTRVVADRLRQLLFELALYDEVADLTAELRTTTAPPATTRPTEPSGIAASPALQPRQRRIGMLLLEAEPIPEPAPAHGESRAAALRASAAARPDLTSIRLPVDTFVLAAARDAFRAANYTRAARLLQRSLDYVEPSRRPPIRLLLGRSRIELGEHAEAASELMRLTDQPGTLAAEALYYVGVAHERMARPDVAVKVYGELLARDDLPPLLKARVRMALERARE